MIWTEAWSAVLSPMYQLIKAATLAYSSADSLANRFVQGGRFAAGGILGHSLTFDELTDITIALWDAWYVPRAGERSIFAWERDWFSRLLPKPPARILVLAAGDGAEVSHLLASGYDVDACEPAYAAYEKCLVVVGRRGRVFQASYQEFVDAISLGNEEIGRFFSDVKYDAVLLGWGSLSHVYCAEARQRLLECCVRLAPTGPILLSFWMRPPELEKGRSEKIGAALGVLIAKMRRIEPAQVRLLHGVWYVPGYAFTQIELDALAAAVGRVPVWDIDQRQPHVAFCQTR